MARGRIRLSEDGRRLSTAGHALVVSVLALAFGSLLSAPGLHKSAYNRPPGIGRDVALAITGPLEDVSRALLLDRPRRLVKHATGRADDDVIDVELRLPPARPPRPSPPKQRRLAFTPERELRLWVAGDSLVSVPGYAVQRAAAASPVIAAVGEVEGRIATGLERPDVFNWFTEIRKRLRELRPHAVVLAFGGNDDHGYMTGLPPNVSLDGFGGQAWAREYRRRVAGLMDLVSGAGAFVVWIGLPQTKDAEQTRRFDVINAAVAAEARERPGRVAFIDTYTLFAGDDGGYAEYVPTASGSLQKVRADDGVHFEPAGGDVIARQVLRRLNAAYDLVGWRKRR